MTSVPTGLKRIGRGLRNRLARLNNERVVRGQRLYNYSPTPSLVTGTTAVDRPSVPAIDVHNHLGYWLNGGRWMVPDVPALLGTMDELGVAAMVNLDGRWGTELQQNLDRYDRAHPGRFATFAHLDWTLLAIRGGADRLPQMLESAKAAGVAGVKVWKDLGLAVRDEKGVLVLPDYPRLAPVWETAGALELPVLIHTADPVAFWSPVDRHNERFEELARHPDWQYGSKSVPTHPRLMEALEHVVADHSGTTFIGAHVASHAENLREVDRLLATYPNLSIDLAARESELGRQPRATRALIEAHPDRVMFGTDCFPVDAKQYRLWFRLLETSDEYFPYSIHEPPERGRWSVSGLNLGQENLTSIYSENARRAIPALANTGFKG